MRTINKLMLLSVLLVSACDGSTVREKLGISGNAPDEFSVVSRPPLSVPPEFDLKPPHKSAPISGIDAGARAQNIIKGREETGIQSSEIPGLTKAEQNLLVKAGANEANPEIRKTLEEEQVISKEKQEKKGFMGKLFGKDGEEEKPLEKPVEGKEAEQSQTSGENKSN